MNQTKRRINELGNRFDDIDYYLLLIEKVEKNKAINPDIAIESCKSLVEGISKFIWKTIDEGYDEKAVNKMDFQPLVKTALKTLGSKTEDLEIELIEKISRAFFDINKIRNERGDISHGRLAPKAVSSSPHYAELIASVTDGMLAYILLVFSNVEIVREIGYDDYPAYNDFLDIDFEHLFPVKYSLALYAQDRVAYEEGLETYLDEERARKEE